MALPGPETAGLNQHAGHELFVRFRTHTCNLSNWLHTDWCGYDLRYPAHLDDPGMVPVAVQETWTPFFKALYVTHLKARHAWAMVGDYMAHNARTREYLRREQMKCEDYRCEVRTIGV